VYVIVRFVKLWSIMRTIQVVSLGLLIVCSGWAQTSGGKIVGTVTDATGASLSGASITVTNTRGQQRKATAGMDGVYVITQLDPATYDLKASREGFTDADIHGITIQVGQEVRRDIVLQVAGTTAAVTVEGGSLAQVDTSSAKVGVNVSARGLRAPRQPDEWFLPLRS
jgi:hypothetical protein